MRIQQPSRKSVGRKTLIIVGSALVAGLVLLGVFATFYTDLLWFKETGFTSVFWTQIRVKILLGAVFGLVFAVILLANLWVVQKITSPNRVFALDDAIVARYRATLKPYVRWLVVLGALIFGFFAGSGASSQWRNWLMFGNSVPFGQTDPVFNKDIAFFVFRLPFHRFVFGWAFSSLLVITLVVAGAHYLMGGIRMDQRGASATAQVKAHLSVLLGLGVLLKGWGYRLDQFNLLYSSRGNVIGASYTDVNAQLPAMKLLVVMAIIVAILFFVNVRVRGWTLPVAGIGLLFLTSILAGGAYPALVQRLRVAPAERLREAPFIDRNIKFTRTAFGLDAITTKPFAGKSDVDRASLDRNKLTVQNIRLWSPDVLTKAYKQQQLRPYYEFLDIDVDRYLINGQSRQVMLAAREISQANLAPSARSWQNTHLTYTHGNGVVASAVDTSTPQGGPLNIVSGVPPKASAKIDVSADTRLYFGESEDTPYTIVRTAVDELDYPIDTGTGGESFKGTRYDGKGGVTLSGPLRKLAFAWRFKDPNLFLSSLIKSDSRLIFRRTIQDRIRQAAPYLKLDHDPYIVLTKDRMTWVQDAYTTTDLYPYSERVDLAATTGGALTGGANYIRNSVKIAVDAVDGSIKMYVNDKNDPIIKMWQKVFPSSYRPIEEAPAELRSHFRYPEDLFLVQAQQYRTYHITDVTNFFTKEDVWALPNDPTNPGFKQPAYYQIMKLPGEKTEEYVLTIPYTPNERQNTTALFVARSDPAHYGELVAYVLPKQVNALGPEQVETNINQDPVYSSSRTLLGSSGAGSRLIQGNLLTIPIEDSLIYVQPIYLAAEGNEIPELKRVVVVSGSVVAVGNNLAQALAVLFGEAPPSNTPPPSSGTTVAALLAEAQSHFDAANASLAKGDFAGFGREFAAAQEAVKKASAQSGSPSPSPSPKASG